LVTLKATDGREFMSYETAEIEVPSTDIVASERLAKALARIAAAQGANIVTRAEVRCLEPLHEDGPRH
jgi:L-2-hydroxyglutarate oxidase LhgO